MRLLKRSFLTIGNFAPFQNESGMQQMVDALWVYMFPQLKARVCNRLWYLYIMREATDGLTFSSFDCKKLFDGRQEVMLFAFFMYILAEHININS